MTIRKIGKALILAPLALIIVAFAVANRQTIAVSFDPFDATHPAYRVAMPLFILIFLLMIVGVIIGGVAAWLRQARWRRAVSRLEAENRNLRAELHALARDSNPADRPMLPAIIEGPPVALRSPVN